MQVITLTREQKEDHNNWINHFKNKYFFEFLNPTYNEVPFVSKFFDNKEVSDAVSKLEYFLVGSYPIDMKTNDHGEMHNSRYSFSEEEYNWHQKHNKLGLNCWGTRAGIGLLRLNKMLKRDDLNVIKSFPSSEEYSSMPFDKKLQFCTSVDKKLYNLLDKLYTDYS